MSRTVDKRIQGQRWLFLFCCQECDGWKASSPLQGSLVGQQCDIMSEIIYFKKNKKQNCHIQTSLSCEHAYIEFLVQGMRARVQTGGSWAGEKALPSEVLTQTSTERASRSPLKVQRDSYPSPPPPPNTADDFQKEAALVTFRNH